MKLATREIGTGTRTAALVHGASMGSDIWRDFAQILIDKYDFSIILIDLRGHGRSEHASSYQIADFAADLIENLPTGLDVLMGQSLGGVSTALASAKLLPRRYVGLDSAFTIGPLVALVGRIVGPVQTRLPDRVLKAIGMPVEGSAPDTLERIRTLWSQWDSSMVRQVINSGRRTPFPVGPPAVPSTLVLAEKSLYVRPKMVQELRALGWDIRIKPGAVHDLHLQDPHGVIDMLDDVLRETPQAT
jgi:pimeloyl-ACP methyl ester carboxylesterase